MKYFFSDRAATKRANWIQRQRAAALVSGAAIFLLTALVIQPLWKKHFWTPLQREYWDQYAQAAWPTNLSDKGSMYRFWQLKPTKNNASAEAKMMTDADVAIEAGKPALARGLTEAGWRPVLQDFRLKDDDAYKWMQKHIYGGKSWLDMQAPPWYAGGALELLSIIGFICWDYSNSSRNRERRVTSNTETQFITPRELARIINGDGLGIPYLPERNRFLTLLGAKATIEMMRIRRRDEAEHILVAADTGQGKSVLFHWWLAEIAVRPERAVVYDASLEFWERHANRKRGDILLHPLSEDMPYWDLAAEMETEADAMQTARSFIPRKDENIPDFWVDGPQKVLAFLLIQMKRQGKGVPDLLEWLADPDLMEEMIEKHDRTLAPLISRDAPQQRTGILASLNMIAEALMLLPGPTKKARFSESGRETYRTVERERFSFKEWAAGKKRSWLFIGCRFPEREALRPLISAWLDTMFGVLMKKPGGQGAFLFLDELPTLQRLPKLKGALQEARKYNIKFVAAFQGRAQLDALYGRESETLMSAPGTRIFLKTKEYSAAEWAAKNIGMPEQERQTDSITVASTGRDSENQSIERRIDYLVRPNQIQNAEKLTGYLRYDRYVCLIKFKPLDLPIRNQFAQREPERLESLPPQSPSSQSASTAGGQKQKIDKGSAKERGKSPPGMFIKQRH